MKYISNYPHQNNNIFTNNSSNNEYVKNNNYPKNNQSNLQCPSSNTTNLIYFNKKDNKNIINTNHINLNKANHEKTYLIKNQTNSKDIPRTGNENNEKISENNKDFNPLSKIRTMNIREVKEFIPKNFIIINRDLKN